MASSPMWSARPKRGGFRELGLGKVLFYLLVPSVRFSTKVDTVLKLSFNFALRKREGKNREKRAEK